MTRITLIALMLFANSVFAGTAFDLFGDGVLGLKWGANPEQVKSVFPKGELSSSFGLTSIEVEDGRKVFGLERDKDEIIRFTFDSENRLAGVSIDFEADDFPVLQQKLITQFGPPKDPVPMSSGVVLLVWENDNGVILTLSHYSVGFERTTAISIGFDKLERPKSSKEDLGL